MLKDPTDSELLNIAIEWLIEFETTVDSEASEQRWSEWIEADPSHLQAYLDADSLWTLIIAGTRASLEGATDLDKRMFDEALEAECVSRPRLYRNAR